ncbi:MAG TPA: Rrf2 family transcriptional regulator [Chondromyces sp.]|nr:Rrf2 family transcriptional regulator [Chondromyces sp.]
MKISTRGRYALRMMLDVARHGGEDAPVSLASVADRTGISHGYLEQVALALKSAALVRGVAGRHGGYKLAKPAREISIRQIVEATIGPICVVDCIDEPEACLRAEFCECRLVYALINQRIGEVLDEFTLGDLADPHWLNETAKAFNEELVGITGDT